MDYTIKEVSYDDLEDCAEVIRQGFGTVAKDFGLTVENCPTNGAFLKVDRLIADMNKGNFMYSFNVVDRIVGFMQLEKKSDEQYELEKLTLLPDYRHLGFGKILIDFAQNKVKESKGKRMTIGIIEENIVLKQWYLDYGFVHTGTRVFEHLPFTVGFMELIID